jgi:hypothetical protein
MENNLDTETDLETISDAIAIQARVRHPAHHQDAAKSILS